MSCVSVSVCARCYALRVAVMEDGDARATMLSTATVVFHGGGKQSKILDKVRLPTWSAVRVDSQTRPRRVINQVVRGGMEFVRKRVIYSNPRSTHCEGHCEGRVRARAVEVR